MFNIARPVPVIISTSRICLAAGSNHARGVFLSPLIIILIIIIFNFGGDL
jgi:hypothetical protein